jgi:adenylate cyclase
MKRTPILVKRPGHPDERVFRLRKGPNTLGRSPESDFVFPSGSLSRFHARIDVSDTDARVVDLGSKNGTFVRRARVQESVLQFGDELRFGDEILVYADQVPDATTHKPTLVRDLEDDISQVPMEEIIRGELAQKIPAEAATMRRLQVLLKVSQALGAPGSIDELLNRVLDLVLQLMDVDRAAVLSIVGDGHLVPLATRAKPGFEGVYPAFSRHIAESAREKGVAVLFGDTRDDPVLAAAESISDQSIRSAMCAPLRTKSDLLGLLYVDSVKSGDRFLPTDLDFLAALANQAAIALDYSAMRQQLQDEALLRGNLMRFFPPAIIDAMKEQHDFPVATMETEVTAIFADISRFTQMAAEMPPREVLKILNEYFPLMSEIVFDLGGTLEKYVGDALLAVWGAPLRHVTDAENALDAAIRMQQLVAEMNRRSRLPHAVHVHIGLNSGDVVAGNIGSDKYLQYATIGSTINIASRVCSIVPEGQIWITESTLVRLGTQKWPIQEIGPVQVKGCEKPVRLYRVCFDATDTPSSLRSTPA